MDRQPAVYLLASNRNGTLYLGVTSDLVARTWQHREHVIAGFTKKYDVTKLVWYELHGTMENGNFARKADQEVAPRLENQVDRRAEPILERSLAADHWLKH